jgi:hypothetical protein
MDDNFNIPKCPDVEKGSSAKTSAPGRRSLMGVDYSAAGTVGGIGEESSLGSKQIADSPIDKSLNR